MSEVPNIELVEPIEDDNSLEMGGNEMLTRVFRGEIEYAFEDDPGWMTFLYRDKRSISINTALGRVRQNSYYEQKRH